MRQRLVIPVDQIAIGVRHRIVTPGVEPLAAFARAQLLGQLRFGLLERHQQVLLQRLPLGVVLLEAFSAGRREAALPLLGRGAALLDVWIAAAYLLGKLLRLLHLALQIALALLLLAVRCLARTSQDHPSSAATCPVDREGPARWPSWSDSFAVSASRPPVADPS